MTAFSVHAQSKNISLVYLYLLGIVGLCTPEASASSTFLDVKNPHGAVLDRVSTCSADCCSLHGFLLAMLIGQRPACPTYGSIVENTVVNTMLSVSN